MFENYYYFFMGLNMANFRLNVLAYSVMLGLTAGVAYAAQPTNQPTKIAMFLNN